VKPERNEKYLAWIRRQPCLVCSHRPCHAHHAGRRHMGQKPSDYTAVPLCPEHHVMGRYAYHVVGHNAFVRMYQIDFQHAIRELNRRWREHVESEISRRAAAGEFR
jgi:hypothetical protein